MKHKITIIKANNISEFKIINYNGTPHFVAPVIIMVEGVHTGATGAAVYYPKEVLKSLPFKWNGVSVPVFHPKVEFEGETYYVSANDPQVLEQQNVGQLFNVDYEEIEGLGRLKGEVYINIEKANKVYPGLIADIRANKQIEVSTGLLDPGMIYQSGSWNDEPYKAIANTIIPDHLALLPGLKGACSWEDGCGIRANEKTNKKGGINSVKNLLSRMLKGVTTRTLIEANIMDNELRRAIDEALVSQSSDEYYVWVRGVDPEKKWFVYEREERTVDGSTGEIKLFKRNFELNEDGSVKLAEEASEVRQKPTEYIEVKPNQKADNQDQQKNLDSTVNNGVKNKEEVINNEQEEKGGHSDMDRKERVNNLINNRLSPYGEGQREYLTNLEDCPFSKIEEMSNNLTTTNEENATLKTKVEKKKEEDVQANQQQWQQKKPETVEEYINNAPVEMQEVLQNGLQLQKDHREQLITSILANTKNKFDKVALDQMSTKLLENIANLAIQQTNSSFYGRQGGPVGGAAPELPTLDIANCFKEPN